MFRKIIDKILEIKVSRKNAERSFKAIAWVCFKVFPLYFKFIAFFDFKEKKRIRDEKIEYERKRIERIETISKKFRGY